MLLFICIFFNLYIFVLKCCLYPWMPCSRYPRRFLCKNCSDRLNKIIHMTGYAGSREYESAVTIPRKNRLRASRKNSVRVTSNCSHPAQNSCESGICRYGWGLLRRLRAPHVFPRPGLLRHMYDFIQSIGAQNSQREGRDHLFHWDAGISVGFLFTSSIGILHGDYRFPT